MFLMSLDVVRVIGRRLGQGLVQVVVGKSDPLL